MKKDDVSTKIVDSAHDAQGDNNLINIIADPNLICNLSFFHSYSTLSNLISIYVIFYLYDFYPTLLL